MSGADITGIAARVLNEEARALDVSTIGSTCMRMMLSFGSLHGPTRGG